MHLSRLNWGYFFPSTSTISIAFDGQFRQHKPQPMQSSISNIGCPRKFSGSLVSIKGTYLSLNHEVYDITLFNIRLFDVFRRCLIQRILNNCQGKNFGWLKCGLSGFSMFLYLISHSRFMGYNCRSAISTLLRSNLDRVSA